MTAVQAAAVWSLANMCAVTAARALANEGVLTAGGSTNAEGEVQDMRPRTANDGSSSSLKGGSAKPAPAPAPPPPSKPAPAAGRGGGRVKQKASVKAAYLRTDSAPALASASPAVKPITKRRRSQSSSNVVLRNYGARFVGAGGPEQAVSKVLRSSQAIEGSSGVDDARPSLACGETHSFLLLLDDSTISS